VYGSRFGQPTTAGLAFAGVCPLASDKTRGSYKDLVEQCQGGAEGNSVEDKLDALLATASKKPGAKEVPGTSDDPISPLDMLRQRLRTELIPAFQEIKEKYADRSIELNMDASDFLQGGRKLVIEFTIRPHSVRLDGTVMDTGIAFNEIRSNGGTAGAISSGPMLRTRLLTPEKFREFICGRIALLVQSILRQRR